jgi:hypothetical protein
MVLTQTLVHVIHHDQLVIESRCLGAFFMYIAPSPHSLSIFESREGRERRRMGGGKRESASERHVPYDANMALSMEI